VGCILYFYYSGDGDFMINEIKLFIFLIWTVSFGWSTLLMAYWNITGQIGFSVLTWAVFLGADWLGYKCTKDLMKRMLWCQRY
jgi:hypothetical protein